MDASSRIIAALERHRTALDLAEDGLGERLCAAFTDGVLGCIVGEHAPDGTPWGPLSEDYAREKAREFPGRPMAVREFLMARPDEVAGEVEVAPSEASVTFGRTARARDEGAWFQEGDPSNNRPPRPFWGFTESSEAEVGAILGRRFRDVVR